MNIYDKVIAVSDRGLAYGDGLFETIAVLKGQLHHWSRHWSRLKRGAERLQLLLPDEGLLLSAIDKKLHSTRVLTENKVLKIIITRGSGGRGYQFPEKTSISIIMTVHDWVERPISDYTQGIMVLVCQTCLAQQPLLAGIKHLNRLEQVMAKNELSHDYQEGIMLECDTQKETMNRRIIEGIASNLFFVKDGDLLTAKIDRCGVQGTMREEVLQQAKNMAIVTQEGHYTLLDLLMATEVFFTNSLLGIVPVRSIKTREDNKKFSLPIKDKIITARLSGVINRALDRPY